VLKAFEVVKENYKVYRLRVNLEEDFLLIYRESEKKFSLGQIQMDEYRQASQSFYSQTEAVISAKSEFNQSKIDLELLVGLILEDIEGYAEFLNGLNEEIKRN
jgi:outer membrane protein TolC